MVKTHGLPQAALIFSGIFRIFRKIPSICMLVLTNLYTVCYNDNNLI